MKKNILIVFVLFFSGMNAQVVRPFFNTISIENGLPEGVVVSSFQDKLGYLWFGTQNGLVRYDGYSTKLYPIPDDDGKPIKAPSIMSLFEDKNGVLWTCPRDKGFYIYDRKKDLFRRSRGGNKIINIGYSTDSRKEVYDKKNEIGWSLIYNLDERIWSVESLDMLNGTVDLFTAKSKGRHLIPSGKRTGDVIIDASGNTWLVMNNTLSIYNRASKSFKPYFMLPASMNKILFNNMAHDPVNKDLLWITTLLDSEQDVNKVKLIQFNIKTKEYKTYDHIVSDPNSIAGTCTEFYIDAKKRIFFYNDYGISMYNRKNDKFINYHLKVPGLPETEQLVVTSVASDEEGNLWIGGMFKGLFFLNTRTAVATFYTHTEEAGSLPDFSAGINKIFFDKAGVLWVSMPYEGISWLDPKRSFFNPIKINAPVNKEDKIASTITNRIKGIHSDSTFFVSANKNIFIWNPTTNIFKSINLGAGKKVSIRNAIIDKQGLIWLASQGDGLFCYNPITKKIKNYRNDPKDNFSIISNELSVIKEDNDGNLWIGTIDGGLNSFNKKTEKFTRYPFINNDGNTKANNVLDDSRVHSLLCDKDGIVWIGTNLGSLNKFDTKKGKFTSYLDNKEGLYCIYSIFEDSHKRMWLGTYLTGLFLVNKNSGFIKHFTEKEGLSSNDVKGITEDKKGNIWLATSHGLSKLNPENNQITNYTTINGLPVVETSGIYKGLDGLFYVPIKNGVIPFDPDNIVENKVPPEVVIESVKYYFTENTANKKDTVLFTNGKQELSLKYNENKISFQYVALHFSNPSLNQYAYQLEGYDTDWIPAGTQRSVTYTNLSPGSYTFKVKAANSDGVWNETGAHFNFTILAPWWKTWWAYTLYFLVFIVSIPSYVTYRARNLKRENTILEEKVAIRTNQLTKSIEDLKTTQNQLIQSEKMASLGELTAGIAHEIQNPLNFVNNFSEVSNELLDEMNEEIGKGDFEEAKSIANDIKKNLEKINYHGKRADSIVKGMLQHIRIGNNIKEPTNINKLGDEYLRLAYHGLRAKDKSFNADLVTDFDENLPKINVLAQEIGRVLLNLFTNAFYATHQKQKKSGEAYKPMVSVKTILKDKGIEITVKDNGIGIPETIKDKIMQPFFTTKPSGEGTGLGLSLSYDIVVKAHGGTIAIDSRENDYTVFTILLPIE
ncbi:MAG TPA: two-component regulator propeller domain-containing protein [Flavobacterium sp.]|uniref:sensor histidine kinase n=1 Tax=Flavobacterium sp. TaxID=239 RepID=UPI002DB77617|nr:two-component regulator propeller domain-containing protein [Flavobacterium sp.]HEU4791123.1 two-component regulator propeller domain-containing protein [Flavobacterium sp.]